MGRTRKPGKLEHALANHIAHVRLRAQAALLRRLDTGYGFADARIPAEVFLRDATGRERMSRDSLRPRGTHTAQAQEIAREIAAVEATLASESDGSPLAVLFGRLGLDAAERALLSIAVAYELDADVRDLCHALAWRRPSALFGDVCQELSDALAPASAVLGALHPAGTLRRMRCVEVGDELGGSRDVKIACTVSLGRGVLDWLCGDTRIAGPLRGLVRLYATDQVPPVYLDDATRASIARVSEALRGAPGRGEALPLVLVQGPTGAGKRAVAQALARALGRPLCAIALAETMRALGPLRDREAGMAGVLPGVLIDRALGEARLRDAVAYLPGVEILRGNAQENPSVEEAEARRIAIQAIEQHGDVAILATSERGIPSLAVSRPFHLIRLGAASLEVRRQAWTTGLTALEAGEGWLQTAGDLAARYVIGPGAIGDVIEDARAFARATGEPATRTTLEEAVGRRLTLRLGSFGTLITRKARMDEMVLPDDVVDTLHDMIAMVRERTQILERWGYSEHLGLSRGVSALFSGEPGTGKTMAASVIAGALGLELIRIDLSAVTSKWVGETEKHLARIFDEAQSASAMLLFDEADSLFGKRTKLESAQDRYANLEVNYVLQRMESFDGISILTSNFESAIDPAFLRRLNFRVRFPEPEEDEREMLWRRLLPPDTGIADRVDFRALAERFVMTGGHIRNAIVRAAVVAAREGRVMEPRDLTTGAHHEYFEMGKVMPAEMA